MYARRPKVYNLLDIELKFNEELFSRAEYLNKNGISVFAGAPLVSRFEELNFDASCIWFNLKPNEKIRILYCELIVLMEAFIIQKVIIV